MVLQKIKINFYQIFYNKFLIIKDGIMGGKREEGGVNGQEREGKSDQNGQKPSHPHTPSDTGVGITFS